MIKTITEKLIELVLFLKVVLLLFYIEILFLLIVTALFVSREDQEDFGDLKHKNCETINMERVK